MIEEKGNLFELDNSYALAHCVGSDFVMGAGIAKIFKQKYGNQEWLINNCKNIGETLLLSKDKVGINIFYLITKKYSKYEKPTYENLEKAIIDMFKQATEHNILKIGMPKIGCGLDGKEWSIVKEIIAKHRPNNIEIIIRYI
jgi:O-acetyl-ADP-ribose deacetylase (regulator of RNase III)